EVGPLWSSATASEIHFPCGSEGVDPPPASPTVVRPVVRKVAVTSTWLGSQSRPDPSDGDIVLVLAMIGWDGAGLVSRSPPSRGIGCWAVANPTTAAAPSGAARACAVNKVLHSNASTWRRRVLELLIGLLSSLPIPWKSRWEPFTSRRPFPAGGPVSAGPG